MMWQPQHLTSTNLWFFTFYISCEVFQFYISREILQLNYCVVHQWNLPVFTLKFSPFQRMSQFFLDYINSEKEEMYGSYHKITTTDELEAAQRVSPVHCFIQRYCAFPENTTKIVTWIFIFTVCTLKALGIAKIEVLYARSNIRYFPLNREHKSYTEYSPSL